MLRRYADRSVDKKLPRARMPKLLWRADCLLRKDEFLEPLGEEFSTKMGRPTMPLERFLRLMFLRSHYRWSYEQLLQEVSSTPCLQRFCRLGAGERMPHPTTLSKLANKIGPAKVQKVLGSAAARLGVERSESSCFA